MEKFLDMDIHEGMEIRFGDVLPNEQTEIIMRPVCNCGYVFSYEELYIAVNDFYVVENKDIKVLDKRIVPYRCPLCNKVIARIWSKPIKTVKVDL